MNLVIFIWRLRLLSTYAPKFKIFALIIDEFYPPLEGLPAHQFPQRHPASPQERPATAPSSAAGSQRPDRGLLVQALPLRQGQQLSQEASGEDPILRGVMCAVCSH
jgi:hypothetical protein